MIGILLPVPSDIGAQSDDSLPSPELGQRMARVPSAYIRQMVDENLLIPGRALTLIDTIGQGKRVITKWSLHTAYTLLL